MEDKEYEEYYKINDEKKVSQEEDLTGFDKKTEKVKFNRVIHRERAEVFNRISDGNTTKFLNVALEYFNYRCALSGEEFVIFDEQTNSGRKAKTNLSAEHMVPLCIGGDDIVPNLLPSVIQYNLQKNGYYPIDYLKQAKDINGNSIYSVYRLLKALNYMMKASTEEARKYVRERDVRKFKKLILTPNEIDEYLNKIEESEPEKLFSQTITDTEIDEDNKKILKVIPDLERNIPSQKEQENIKVKEDSINMMDIFFYDAIIEIEKELPNEVIEKNGTELSISKFLKEEFSKIKGRIPYEIGVRNKIIEKLEKIGVEDNKYSVANDLLLNSNLLELSKIEEDAIQSFLFQHIENSKSILDEAQVIKAISAFPGVLYDDRIVEKFEFWHKYRENQFDRLISGYVSQTDDLTDTLILLKENGIDITDIKQKDKLEILIERQIEDKEKASRIIEEISSKVINGNIGGSLNSQKNAKKISKFEQALRESGYFTDEEIESLTSRKISNNQTQDCIELLSLLKENGIDITDIKREDDIKKIVERQITDEEKASRIIEEISSKVINGNIGQSLSSQKLPKNVSKFEQALGESGYFTDEEIESLTSRKISDNQTLDFIETLRLLKENGIDITDIRYNDTLEILIERQIEDKEKASRIIEEISSKVINGNVYSMLQRQKKEKNFPKFEQALREAGCFTEEEIIFFISKKSKNPTQDLIELLSELKESGIDITDIRYNDTLEILIERQIEDKEKASRIIEEISSKVINGNVYSMLQRQKKEKNLPKFEQALRESGYFTEEEIEFLTTKKQISDNPTQDFIELLRLLKENGIDITDIKREDDIKKIVERQITDEEKASRIIEEISSKVINGNIGQSLSSQKKLKNVSKFEQALREAGCFTEEIESLTSRKISDNQTQDCIETLRLLKENGIDITDIKQKDKLEILIERQIEDKEKASRIIEEISSKVINGNIGNSLSNQKKLKNIPKFEQALRESGYFTEEEIESLTTKKQRGKNVTKEAVIEMKEENMLGDNLEVESNFNSALKEIESVSKDENVKQ